MTLKEKVLEVSPPPTQVPVIKNPALRQVT